jgi:hypothetical protein
MEIATPSLIDGVHAGGVFGEQRRVQLVVRQVGERTDAWADWPPSSRAGTRATRWGRSACAARRAVLLGEQRSAGILVELRVAVVSVAVGIGQLQRFHHGVDIVGEFIFPYGQIEGSRMFRPRSWPGPGSRNRACRRCSREMWWRRLFGRQMEGRHVFVAQQAAVGLHEFVDLVGDVAAVEVIAHRVHGLGARGAGGAEPFFHGGHGAQGAGEIGLAENIAGARGRAVGQVDALANWATAERYFARRESRWRWRGTRRWGSRRPVDGRLEASAKDLVPKSRSVTMAASTMPGTSADRMPGHRDPVLESVGLPADRRFRSA